MLFTQIPSLEAIDTAVSGMTINNTTQQNVDDVIANVSVNETLMNLYDNELFLHLTEINELCCTENEEDNSPGLF